MAVQQLRRGRVKSSERLEYLVGETRQEKSMCLDPGEDLLLLVGKMDHWQADYAQPNHRT